MTNAVHEIDPKTAQLMLSQGKATLIDVREGWELAQSRIAGAQWNPTSSYDPKKIKIAAGQVAIFLCAAGGRSRKAADAYLAQTGNQAYNLSGGMQSWESTGLPVEQGNVGGLPMPRQLAIINGIGTLALTALGLTVNPWFFAGVVAFATAQTLFGATGICLGGIVLGKIKG